LNEFQGPWRVWEKESPPYTIYALQCTLSWMEEKWFQLSKYSTYVIRILVIMVDEEQEKLFLLLKVLPIKGSNYRAYTLFTSVKKWHAW